MARKSFKNTLHVHGCTGCHLRYEDACADPATNARCITCRGGRAWQLLIDNAAARDCCRTSARLVSKDEKERYRLVGGGLWFICPTCARTFPTNVRSQS